MIFPIVVSRKNCLQVRSQQRPNAVIRAAHRASRCHSEENSSVSSRAAAVLLKILAVSLSAAVAQANAESLRVGWQTVDNIDLFYREGGPADAPTIVFLHR